VRLLEKVVSGLGVPYMFNKLLQQAGLQRLELEAILFQKTAKPYLIPLNGSPVLKFYYPATAGPLFSRLLSF